MTAMTAMWFDVNLDNLSLAPSKVTAWPQDMSDTKARMKEECLESVVALNLDVLFPDEHLLLIDTQEQLRGGVDVAAIDATGCLRLMELKREPIDKDDLLGQALSYSIGQAARGTTAWQRDLACALLFLPEKLARSVEGFRHDERSKGAAGGTNRFEKVRLLVQELRQRRGADPRGPYGADDPVVLELVKRLYGVEIKDLDLGSPERAARAVLDYWGTPERRSVEITVLAPGAGKLTDDVLKVEGASGVPRAQFYLVDAELRRSENGGITKRAVLHWKPEYRTKGFGGKWRADVIRFIRALAQHDREAACLQWGPNPERLRWSPHWYMKLDHESGQIRPSSDMLSEGLAGLVKQRDAGLRAIAKELGGHAGETPLASIKSSLEPAVRLTSAFYRLGVKLGAIADDPYAWHMRPK